MANLTGLRSKKPPPNHLSDMAPICMANQRQAYRKELYWPIKHFWRTI